VSEKGWGLVPPASLCLHKFQGAESGLLQQIHEFGASNGASSRLIRYLQKEGVGASY